MGNPWEMMELTCQIGGFTMQNGSKWGFNMPNGGLFRQQKLHLSGQHVSLQAKI
jgi:exopolysaccharide biosynthesis protein